MTVRHPLVRSAVYQAATGGRAPRACTGRWPEPWPASGTPTARPGTAPLPPTGPMTNLVAALDQVGARAERRGGYAAAADAYERAADLTTDPLASSRSPVRRRSQRLGLRADRPFVTAAVGGPRARRRPGPARRHRPAARPHRGQHRLGHRRAPDLHRGRRTRSQCRPGPRPGDGRRRRGRAHLRRRQRRTAPCRRPSTSTPRRTTRHGRGASSSSWSAPGTTSPETVTRHSTSCTPRRPSPSGRRHARRPRRAGEPRQRRPAARRRRRAQHFYTLMLSRAREDGAVMAVVYALQRLCFGHLRAAATWAALRNSRRGGGRARAQRRAARADGAPRGPG